MKKIYSPQNEVELAVIKSLLNGENIPYYVHNERFGSMEVGPPDLVVQRTNHHGPRGVRGTCPRANRRHLSGCRTGRR